MIKVEAHRWNYISPNRFTDMPASLQLKMHSNQVLVSVHTGTGQEFYEAISELQNRFNKTAVGLYTILAVGDEYSIPSGIHQIRFLFQYKKDMMAFRMLV